MRTRPLAIAVVIVITAELDFERRRDGDAVKDCPDHQQPARRSERISRKIDNDAGCRSASLPKSDVAIRQVRICARGRRLALSIVDLDIGYGQTAASAGKDSVWRWSCLVTRWHAGTCQGHAGKSDKSRQDDAHQDQFANSYFHLRTPIVRDFGFLPAIP